MTNKKHSSKASADAACSGVAAAFLIPSQVVHFSSRLKEGNDHYLGHDLLPSSQLKSRTRSHRSCKKTAGEKVEFDVCSVGNLNGVPPISAANTDAQTAQQSQGNASLCFSGDVVPGLNEEDRKNPRRKKRNRNRKKNNISNTGHQDTAVEVRMASPSNNDDRILESLKLEDGGDVFQAPSTAADESKDHEKQGTEFQNGKKHINGELVGSKRATLSRTGEMKWSGTIPDVYWGAIPMSHLRCHPFFEPLPNPEKITKLEFLEDVRQFRQDSWQWDALHSGRCTTSQAAGALGFLEPNAARFLGIPRSLQKGGIGAFQRLRQRAIRTLKEMETTLCQSGGNEKNNTDKEIKDGSIWSRLCSNYDIEDGQRPSPFAAKYMLQLTERDTAVKRGAATRRMSGVSSIKIRMNWGNAQEPTALLKALNYFWKSDDGVILKEVGMCGAGLALNTTSSNGDNDLIIGATPDAVIQYSNGTLEVLEVKNHCPFVPEAWGHAFRKQSNYRAARYVIRELPLEPTVPPAYIPQLMMEMLCLGPQCKSAVMVRQTATNGATILRLHRDDDWIQEMLYWLKRFTTDFVSKGVPPSPNFFWSDKKEATRYMAFVRRTKSLGEEVELLETVDHSEIQRVMSGGKHQSLFLD